MDDSSGRLYVVGTPIGNLDDISARAAQVLRRVAAIYCEDTRVTARLAARLALPPPRISCHEHNEARRAAEVVARLAAGEDLALVSDAGMPAISDPGARIVQAAAGAGFPVLSVPGPSAPIAALSVSGLRAVPHVFLGFPPARAAARRRLFAEYCDRPETLVFLEAPHRLVRSLADATPVFGGRRAIVARELTKVHEEVRRATVAELAREFESRARVLGEIAVVIEGADRGSPKLPETDLAWELSAHRNDPRPAREIAREISRRTGVASREVYRRLVEGSRGPRR
jgi:16S rRNA (cytidine1402-2'-O)-methyltransferase